MVSNADDKRNFDIEAFQQHVCQKTRSERMFVGSSSLLANYNLPSVFTLDSNTFSLSYKLKILGVTLD